MSSPIQAGKSHVIAGALAGQPLVNIQKPWRRIRDRAGLSDVRIHDLRHGFASVVPIQSAKPV